MTLLQFPVCHQYRTRQAISLPDLSCIWYPLVALTETRT